VLDSVRRSPSELWHACVDATIATIAGGLVLLILYPVTLCAGAVKGLLTILGLRASRQGRERVELLFASHGSVSQNRGNDGQRLPPTPVV
jgi:hypothetical protein